MKLMLWILFAVIECRAPQGARGLKYCIAHAIKDTIIVSRPARGAWVEIL